MKKIFSLIKNNEFVKNVLTLLTGSTIGQVFVLLVMPVISRLYSEELFGIYFIFISTINILKKVTTLRLELAIVLPKKDFWAINAFALSFLFTFLTSSFFLVMFAMFHKLLTNIADLSQITQYYLLLPVTLFFIGIYETFSAWNNRKKQYKKMSIGKITFNFTTGGLQIGAYFTLLKKSGLIFGFVLGQAIGAITMVSLTIKDILKNIKDVKLKRMKIILIRYKKIPTFNTLINFVTNISNEIPIYLITGFYSTAVAGFYGMANKIVGTPFSLLGNSIGQVFYQKASETINEKKPLKPLIKSNVKNTFKIIALPVVLILIFSPFIYIILGDEWRRLWMYIYILLPSFVIGFVAQPISVIPTITNKQHILVVLLVLSTIIKFIAFFVGFRLSSNPLIALAFLSIVSTLFRVYLIIWIYKSS